MPNFLDRSVPILGQEGLDALSAPLISFAGLGGVGGGAFLTLVRSGVKRFRLAENGIFDPPDMNRQAAAFASTMDQPKIEVYERLAKEINPEVELELFPEGVQANNLERFLEGSDLHVGVIDWEKGEEVKAMAPELLKRFNIPVFSAMVIGFGAVMVAHHPDIMMPDEFWGLVKEKSQSKVFPSFILDGFGPVITDRTTQAIQTGKIPSTSTAGAFAGAILASEVTAYLLRKSDLVNRDIIFAPRFMIIDPMGPVMEILDVTDQ